MSDIPCFRSFSSWYFLQNFIKKNIPGIKIDDLPPRHLLWIKNEKDKLEELGYFLKSIICNKKLLSNKVIQLFLQSNVSEVILQENIDKLRDDDVVRTNFSTLNFNQVSDTKVDSTLMLNNTSNQYFLPTMDHQQTNPIKLAFKICSKGDKVLFINNHNCSR